MKRITVFFAVLSAPQLDLQGQRRRCVCYVLRLRRNSCQLSSAPYRWRHVNSGHRHEYTANCACPVWYSKKSDSLV